MIHSGQPARDFIDSATRHVLLRQGVLGIKVKIMRGNDPDGKSGLQKSLPDTVTVIEPKEEAPPGQPSSQDYVCPLQRPHCCLMQSNILTILRNTGCEG